MSKTEVQCILSEAGFSDSAALTRATMLYRCAEDLGKPGRTWWVPGRIEVLGKHTDYAGGRSLLCATDVGVMFAASARNDAVLVIRDLRSNQQTSFEISSELETATGDWTNYPRTAARRLARNFGSVKGADISFLSDLPPAAGMSSSSALIVAFCTILIQLNSLDSTESYLSNISSQEDLAGYLGTVENGKTFGTLDGDSGVGTFGGSEDHTAILCSSSGTLKQYAFCPVVHEQTASFPDSHVFVIASSGVVAEKTGAALELYNRASRIAGAATDAIGKRQGKAFEHLAGALRSVERAALRTDLEASPTNEFTTQDLLDRFDQFVMESEETIPQATSAIDRADLEKFSDCVTVSQETGARLLKNQIEQTEWLASRAPELGAECASAFGAGFGGSVWALVIEEQATGFLSRWRDAYLETYTEHAETAEFLMTRPGPAAFEIILTKNT